MTLSLAELQGPSDSISSVHFHPSNPSYLLVSSWDTHLRLYDTSSQQLLRDYTERAPILDACFIKDDSVVSASLDGSIRTYNLTTNECIQTPCHKKAVSCVIATHGILVTGSWDRTICIHDQGERYIELPGKVFSMSSNDEHIVVAMSNRQIYIFAIADLISGKDRPIQRRESSLKFMTRTLQCTLTSDPKSAGYVTTSIEGRVAVEFMDPSESSQARKYAFKCHRQKEADKEDEVVVFPVNAVEFHPRHHTFATAGGDGVISMWDLKNKKRVKQYPSIGRAIRCLAFSSDGKTLAIGTMTSEDTDSIASKEGHVYLRTFAENEGKGK